MSERTLYAASPAMFRNRPIGFLIGCALCGILIGIPPMLIWWLRCKGTTLTVSDRRTTLRRGILSKHTSEVWHKDVRNVRIDQSFLQRVFGVGEIKISSSGQADFEIAVEGIPSPLKVKSLIDQARMASSDRTGTNATFEPKASAHR
ncbi:MAG: PH domain-containing protein [Hyphomicrobiaceae bacterium]|nr:MAG: PH domain-containing protein [Hyphomicrobiaceae bacterium]